VNPVDEDGQAFEDPVQVIKRDIATAGKRQMD